MENAAHLIARQYEAWSYPPPFPDIAAQLERGYVQMGDPALYSPALWPEGRPRQDLKVLVAGCGTVQAAVLAYTNRGCQVAGVDVSEASLAHERFLQDRHQLSNLTLYKGDLQDVHQIGRDFDVIFATGVLHHLADPDAGLRALASVLAPHGVLVGMVYGATRRAGVYMVQDALRRLGVKQDAAGVAFVRRLLAELPPGHFVRRYLEVSGELKHDAALVDTFLNPQDRAYTVPEVLAFIERCGLVFQSWVEPSWYWPEGNLPPNSETDRRVRALPDKEQWAVVEMLTAAIATHVFYCRPATLERQVYDLDFMGADALSYAPKAAPGILRKGSGYARGVMDFQLGPAEQELFEACDGRRSMAELLSLPALASRPNKESFGRAFMAHLWKLGHLMVSRHPGV